MPTVALLVKVDAPAVAASVHSRDEIPDDAGGVRDARAADREVLDRADAEGVRPGARHEAQRVNGHVGPDGDCARVRTENGHGLRPYCIGRARGIGPIGSHIVPSARTAIDAAAAGAETILHRRAAGHDEIDLVAHGLKREIRVHKSSGDSADIQIGSWGAHGIEEFIGARARTEERSDIERAANAETEAAVDVRQVIDPGRRLARGAELVIHFGSRC